MIRKVNLRSLKFTAGFVAAITCLFVLQNSMQHTSVHAVSAADWNAGRIIDDGIFFNKYSMTASQIQDFLNAKVPSCDTNGTGLTTRVNSATGQYYTRAQWGALQGNPAPYTCLKNYVENPTTHVNNYHSPGAAVTGGISAAQIIWNTAQTYNINPEVLLVTLQKEQGLVTDDWPYQSEYIHAMGANCPDTPSGCDPAYSGFATQTDRSGDLFNYYRNNISQFNFNVGSNYVLWNVQSTGCGGDTVNIQSISTAMLYIYTPYQPNSASVSAFPGQGDGCSSYGNRNFWYYFNNWFGTSRVDKPVANVNWSFENLDGGTLGVHTGTDTTGEYPSATLYNGVLYNFYYDATTKTLNMAKDSASGWQYQTVDTTAGMDNGKFISSTVYNNQIHLVYYDSTNGNLRHAWYSAVDGWKFETLDGSATALSGIEGNVGITTSVGVLGDSLQVFYYDQTSNNLKHAWFSVATGWKFETLDGSATALSGIEGNVGQNPTVSIDGSSIQLYYYDVGNGNLRHAWTDATHPWKFENLDGDAGSIAHNNANVGQDPTILVQGASIQLFYFDVGNGNLRHAWTDATHPWKFENLDGDAGSIAHNNANVGSMSKVLSYNNVLYVFYHDTNAGLMRYAWSDSTGWHFANLEGGPYSVSQLISNTGFWPTVVSYQGSVQLFYFDNDQRSMRHAWGTPYF